MVFWIEFTELGFLVFTLCLHLQFGWDSAGWLHRASGLIPFGEPERDPGSELQQIVGG